MKGLEYLKNGNYNPKIDYNALLTHYSSLVENGKHDEVKAVLREFDGLVLGNKYKN